MEQSNDKQSVTLIPATEVLRKEVMVLNEEREVTLDCLLQPVGDEFDFIDKRPALLILPGGGYWYCSAREAETAAYPFLHAGYQVFVLRYSVRNNREWPNALKDYEQAIRLIRSHSEEWNLLPDKVAVLGFSGGAHVAACAATMSSEKPNAAILGYPPTLGATIEPYLRSFVEPAAHVDKNTCPCFLFSSRNDPLIPVENTVRFIHEMDKAGVSYECHIYAYGPHGFSTGSSALRDPSAYYCSRYPNWLNDSIEWLKDMLGDFSANGFSEPKFPHRVDGDEEEILSAYCSLNYLLKNKTSTEIIQPVLSKIKEKFKFFVSLDFYKDEPDTFDKMFSHLPLEELAVIFGVPKSDVAAADEKLKRIKNVK